MGGGGGSSGSGAGSGGGAGRGVLAHVALHGCQPPQHPADVGAVLERAVVELGGAGGVVQFLMHVAQIGQQHAVGVIQLDGFFQDVAGLFEPFGAGEHNSQRSVQTRRFGELLQERPQQLDRLVGPLELGQGPGAERGAFDPVLRLEKFILDRLEAAQRFGGLTRVEQVGRLLKLILDEVRVHIVCP